MVQQKVALYQVTAQPGSSQVEATDQRERRYAANCSRLKKGEKSAQCCFLLPFEMTKKADGSAAV